MGASNNIILCLCDPVDQPSANMCANLCPAHLKSFFHILLITAQRCDDTVDNKRVDSCVLEHLFLERVEPLKISSKNPGDALFKDGVRDDVVASIVEAGERRGLLGVGFENMMRSWVMK